MSRMRIRRLGVAFTGSIAVLNRFDESGKVDQWKPSILTELIGYLFSKSRLSLLLEP